MNGSISIKVAILFTFLIAASIITTYYQTTLHHPPFIRHASQSEVFNLSTRIGIFYYPWYGKYRHWNESGQPPKTWASNYLPDILPGYFLPEIELYNSVDEAVILWQVYLMKRARIGYVIVSWWGPGSYEDIAFETIIETLNTYPNPHPNLKWCILYEKEGYDDPPLHVILDDIRYIIEKYGSYDYYLKIDNKPVIFVYADPNDSADYVFRWLRVREIIKDIYIVLKVFDGFRAYEDLIDSWYQYAPINRVTIIEPYSGTVSPGFWKYGEEPILLRNDQLFDLSLNSLMKSNVMLKIIISWNEWHEGTQIEPGQEVELVNEEYLPTKPSYDNAFIDLIRKYILPIYDYEPIIEVSSNVINTGSMITVEGSQFPPDTMIYLKLGNNTLRIVITDSGGHFSTSLIIPDINTGTYPLIAVDNEGNVAVAILYIERQN
jgi:hypothetical protein